jgi:hypothetical protein
MASYFIAKTSLRYLLIGVRLYRETVLASNGVTAHHLTLFREVQQAPEWKNEYMKLGFHATPRLIG